MQKHCQFAPIAPEGPIDAERGITIDSRMHAARDLFTTRLGYVIVFNIDMAGLNGDGDEACVCQRWFFSDGSTAALHTRRTVT